MTGSFVFISPLLPVCFVHGSSLSSLSASLLVRVFLAASLFPQHPGEVPGGSVCHGPGVQGQWRRALQVLGVLHDPAECPERGEGAGTATSIRAELSPEVQVKWAGARDHSGMHPAVKTRDAKCYFCSSALA